MASIVCVVCLSNYIWCVVPTTECCRIMVMACRQSFVLAAAYQWKVPSCYINIQIWRDKHGTTFPPLSKSFEIMYCYLDKRRGLLYAKKMKEKNYQF